MLAAALMTTTLGAGAAQASAPEENPDVVAVEEVQLPGGVRHGLQLKVLGRSPSATPLIAGTGASGYTPAQVRAHLGLTGTGAGQTIAIVTAYDAPNVVKDLEVFNKTFGLPPPPSFRKVNQSGGTKYPSVNASWALETALDVQWAHALAPDAAILLVEASTSSLSNLLTAVSYAAKQAGVTVISNSYGTSEFSKQSAQDYRCKLTTAVCVFASGDNGNPGTYPATNPHVLAVGGTTLHLDAAGALQSETAWSGSGGGISLYSAKPSYQVGVTSAARRTSPDVSYGADPQTGFAVYNTTPYMGQTGWFQMGGTSAGAPQWAGIIASANQLRRAAGKPVLTATTSTGATPLHTAVYKATSGIGDIVTGTNGTCGTVCSALPGYDTVTGVGSPRKGIDVVLRDAA
jgi:subtilase family serine protease